MVRPNDDGAVHGLESETRPSSNDSAHDRNIAVTLSGGGSRAIAFHLGCLRALERHGLLERVETLSTVSGGSVIGAMYASRTGSFDDFEKDVQSLLAAGLLKPAVKQFLRHEAVYAVAETTALVTANTFRWFGRRARRLLGRTAVPADGVSGPPIVSRHSRTVALVRALDTELFSGARLSTLRPDGPRLIINACEMTHGSAFYFSAEESGSWRHGRIVGDTIRLAEAVGASAAYPLALPALDRTFTFEKKGERRSRRVSLTDGGVYDNTALAPLWPERDSDVSIEVKKPDIVIACRAGYGLRAVPLAHFTGSRLSRVANLALARVENASVQRLFRTQAGGGFDAVALPYLGQNDANLACAPNDLVAREEVIDYPTNFSPMSTLMINRIASRGEQLTIALLHEHIPGLLASGANATVSTAASSSSAAA